MNYLCRSVQCSLASADMTTSVSELRFLNLDFFGDEFTYAIATINMTILIIIMILITNILKTMIMIIITTSSWSSKRLREEQLSERLCVRCHQPFSLLFNRYLFSSSLCWMFLGSSIWTNRFFAFFGYISTGILASISSTSSGISVPLSSPSPRRSHVDHFLNQATGLLIMWIGCLSILLNSPLRLPALDLRPVQPTKVGAHILASREKNVNFGHFLGEKNLFLPEASSSSYNLKWSILKKVTNEKRSLLRS